MSNFFTSKKTPLKRTALYFYTLQNDDLQEEEMIQTPLIDEEEYVPPKNRMKETNKTFPNQKKPTEIPTSNIVSIFKSVAPR